VSQLPDDEASCFARRDLLERVPEPGTVEVLAIAGLSIAHELEQTKSASEAGVGITA